MNKPSDKAIAAALWAHWENPPEWNFKAIFDRPRELDATAAPVVVGEDLFLRDALQRLCKAVDANNGSAVTITKADACAIGRALTAALAGD